MVEKRSMLKQHNMRSCRLLLASFYTLSFFTLTRAALFEILKANTRIKGHRHNSGLVPAYNIYMTAPVNSTKLTKHKKD